MRLDEIIQEASWKLAKSDATKRAERNAQRREKRAADRAERDAEKAASAAKEKKLLNKYWSVFTDEVAQGYPDSDPIDNLVQRYRDFDYDKLEAAAKMHGYDHPMDYYDELDAQIKADRAADDMMSKEF